MKEKQISVKVRYLNLVRDRVGKRDQTFMLPQNSNLADLLKNMRETYESRVTDYLFTTDGSLKPHIRIAREGTSVQEAPESRLTDGTELYIYVAISGG